MPRSKKGQQAARSKGKTAKPDRSAISLATRRPATSYHREPTPPDVSERPLDLDDDGFPAADEDDDREDLDDPEDLDNPDQLDDSVDSADPNDQPHAPAATRLLKFRDPAQWHWTNLLRLRSQLAISLLAGAGTVLVTHGYPLSFERVGDTTLYLTVLIGVASVLALVSSVTFGFLLHYTQSLTAAKESLYATFRAEVRSLREFLDTMYAEGSIGPRYDYHFGLIDEITRKDFPFGWHDRLDPLLEYVEEQKDILDENDFGRLLRGVAYRVNLLEEVGQLMFRNFVGQVLVQRVTQPVLKSFGALAAVMLVILLTPLTFDLVPRPVSWGVNSALGYLTFVLLVEVAMVVKREMSDHDPTRTTEDH